MVDYQANSDKSKLRAIEPKPEKKLEKVVSGDVVVLKPSVGSRLKKIFLGGDVDSAAQYVFGQVILPALRNIIVETVSRGAEQLMYGESGRRPPPRSPNYGPRVMYNNPLSRQEPRMYHQPPHRWAESSRAADRVMVTTRAEAEAVVDQLVEAVDKYGLVTRADLNEVLGLESAHIDHKWGWDNLARTEIRQTRDGYEITFPPVEEIQ